MDTIRYGKWGGWIAPVSMMLCFFAVICAQPGFLSIDCGGKTNYTSQNNITWVTDANYIDVGETADIGNVTEAAHGSSLDSLRYFPKPLKKSCYHLPVPSNVPYLLRLWFVIGNYKGYQSLPSFAYSFETVDMLATSNLTISSDSAVYDERVLFTSGTVMYVCLIRTSDRDDPFISGIELRTLQDGMYPHANPGTGLKVESRMDVGGKSIARYPEDNFDTFSEWIEDYSMIMVPNTTNSRAFTLDEIVAATQDYIQKIGQGGFGSVFLGKLPEGNLIAVKVLSLFSKQGIHEFLNEVDLLSKINHRNLVSLLGYCNETREVMLVYDYMSEGSLKDHLYGCRAEESELSWKTRLKIALDAAHGLGCTPKIIHRDVKSANILLDSNMNGKLADFGLSRMTIDREATHVTTAVKGTAGYLDPEYYSTQMLTEKSDVYSFGVVLLEIICGRQPIDVKLPLDEVNIIRWVTLYVADMDENGGRIAEIIDKRLEGSYDLKSIIRVAKVAMRCVEAKPSLRPSVSEVVRELKKAVKIEEKASVSLSEDIGIDSGELLVTPLYLSMDNSMERKGMEWGDNSSNISKVGR